jgi:hypothetical protein
MAQSVMVINDDCHAAAQRLPSVYVQKFTHGLHRAKTSAKQRAYAGGIVNV